MVKIRQPDYILVGSVIVLLISGILILNSVSLSFSLEKYGNTYSVLVHQLLLGLIPGIILGIIVFKIPLSFLKKWALPFFLLNIFLLIMVFLPGIGTRIGGAARWLSLGPLSFQPSELLKLTFILYLAAWLTSKEDSLNSQKIKRNKEGIINLIVFLTILALIIFLLYYQPDISTLVTILFIGGLMYFLSNTPVWHGIFLILLGAGGLVALAQLASYRLNRFLVFLKPEIDPMGIGYQIKQALIAVGSGGIFGLGLGMSRQKFGFLPQTMSDSIFAVFSEETGLIGSLFLVFLFLIILWRGSVISRKAKGKFSQSLALGITFLIVIQAFIHIGSMIGILPLTGSPLPFISSGGSHLIVEIISMGILLNISKNV